VEGSLTAVLGITRTPGRSTNYSKSCQSADAARDDVFQSVYVTNILRSREEFKKWGKQAGASPTSGYLIVDFGGIWYQGTY
jgi:hypothetical protein